ncbi:MAG: hypothetical protein N2440_04990 [Actinobacteria bacterium]|nr:hypothetical protein [Actinomycetota bacterium]
MINAEGNEKLVEELKNLRQEISELKEVLADILFILSVDSTETMQVTENTSQLLRGEVPSSCRTAHFRLREHIIQIASRWNKDRASDLRKHLFGHD